MIPIPIADPNSEIDFTEKDIAQMTEQEKFMNGLIDKHGKPTHEVAPIMKAIFKEDPKENAVIEKHKWLNNINTFQAHKNELCLRGTDEDGKDLTIWFDSYDFLQWINQEQIEYIKEQLNKYINKI